MGIIKRKIKFFKILKKMGIEDKVHVYGYVSEEEKKRLINENDIFILTSYQEGFGIVVIEAMATGMPVISTRCGGVEDIIEDGVNGFLVDKDDDEKMANIILKLKSNPELRKKISRNAYKTVKEKFSFDKICNQFKQIFDSFFSKVFLI